MPVLDEIFGAARCPSVHLPDGWAGFGGVHGGLLIAVVARSMQEVSARPLRSLHVDLSRPVMPGELEISATLDRDGASVSFASAAARQDGKHRLSATAILGEDRPPQGAWDDFLDPRMVAPLVAGPGDCDPLHDQGPALRAVEFRPASDGLPFEGAGPEFLVWMSLRDDDEPLDPSRLLVLSDAPPPGVFGLVPSPIAVPTVEYTAHLFPAARAPLGAWVLARMRTVAAGAGWWLDDCELWSERGDLLLTSRQTRRLVGAAPTFDSIPDHSQKAPR